MLLSLIMLVLFYVNVCNICDNYQCTATLMCLLFMGWSGKTCWRENRTYGPSCKFEEIHPVSKYSIKQRT